jgi:hypothetical protein
VTFSSTEIFAYGSGLSAFWALVGWVSNHWLTTARDRLNRKKAGLHSFLAVIATHRAKLDTSANYNEQDFFERSLEPIGQAIHTVRDYLTEDQWKKVEAVWLEYSSQKKSEYGGGIARTYLAMMGSDSHQERLIQFLDRFRDAIK